MDLTPPLILVMWSAGLAAGGALVARWNVVGPGYSWLASGVVVIFGFPAAGAGGEPIAWVGLAFAVLAGIAGRSSLAATALFGASAVAFGVSGLGDSPVLPIITGAVFLGAVTSEMMLGHWYLVDPRLPRWSLKGLVVIGTAGLAADVGYLATEGVFDWEEAGTALGLAFIALGLATVLLSSGVWFSLKVPRYTGVMAATGLGYLATLTAIGVAVVGRMVAFPG